MSTARDRRHARAAAAARARAAELADRWEHAPRRAPRHGHGSDCPHRLDGRMRRCRWCLAEAKERGAQVVNGVVVPASSALAPAQRQAHPDAPTTPCVAVSGPTTPVREAEMRSCPDCYAPTTDPEGHCR